MVNISDQHLNRLIPWFGYGDFLRADIIFLGNEEGLSGKAHRASLMIEARASELGNDMNSWLSNDRDDGCWEMSASKADQKVLHYINEATGESEEWTSFTRSPMLRYQARLLLSLKNCDVSWSDINSEDVSLYMKNDLYSPDSSIKSALMDLRPIPRADETKWIYNNIDEKQYFSAFRYNRNSHKSKYFPMADKRASILKRAIESSNARLIIGIGDREAKANFFNKYFSNYSDGDLKFDKICLSTCWILVSTIKINDRVIKILLCPFFDHYGRGKIKTSGLKELTELHIRPFWEKFK